MKTKTLAKLVIALALLAAPVRAQDWFALGNPWVRCVVAAAADLPANGSLYLCATLDDSKLHFWDGTAWVTVLASSGLSSDLASAAIYVGNSSNVATARAMSGDVAISNTGATTIQSNSVALGTDTTGGYAASATEAGAATSVAADAVALGTDTTGGYAGSSTEGGSATSAALLLGGGADDADAGLVRASNNVDIVCAEKAATGADSCIDYTSSDTWRAKIAGTARLVVSASKLDFTGSTNTAPEFTLDGGTFGFGSQGSSSGFTLYANGSAEDALTKEGYMVSAANILGFNSGNSSSNDVKPQGQLKGGQSKTLTDGSATAFVRLTMSSGSTIGGRVLYQVGATDATDFQSRSGLMVFSAVDKAGTITCTVSTVAGDTEVVAVSTGTLTNTAFTCADAGSNLLELRANMDSSLTTPTVTMKWQLEVIGVQGTLVVTPQ